MIKKFLNLAMILMATVTVHAQDADIITYNDDNTVWTSGDFQYAYDEDKDELSVITWAEGVTPKSTVTIPDNLIEEGLAGNFTIPVVGIEENAFSSVENAGNLVITEVKLGANVVTLGNSAFNKLTALESINLENIVSTGNSCFIDCTSLTSVSFDNLITMNRYTLARMTKLKDVYMPKVETMGLAAIFDCDAIERINIPKSATSIGQGALMFRCSNMVGVQFNWDNPTEATIVEKNFFLDNDGSLNTPIILVPEGSKSAYEDHTLFKLFPAENIVEGTIDDLDAILEDIENNTPVAIGNVFIDEEIEYTVTSLEPLEAAVSGTSNATLTKLDIPATATYEAKSTDFAITTIGASAFSNNSVVEEVMLPSSVKTIENSAFFFCTSLHTINTENVEVIGNHCFRATLMTSLDLGNVTHLGLTGNGLARAYGLTGAIDLPNVQEIGGYAFVYVQGVTEINLGKNLTSVNGNTFFGAGILNTVNISATTPPICDTETFNTGNTSDRTEDNPVAFDFSTITLNVPTEEAKALYEVADGWKTFGTIEVDSSLLSTDIIAQTLGFSVYPNPVENVINIDNNQSLNTTVALYNINGQEVLTTTANSLNNTINVADLASGIYLMKVSTDTYTFVERIIKK